VSRRGPRRLREGLRAQRAGSASRCSGRRGHVLTNYRHFESQFKTHDTPSIFWPRMRAINPTCEVQAPDPFPVPSPHPDVSPRPIRRAPRPTSLRTPRLSGWLLYRATTEEGFHLPTIIIQTSSLALVVSR